MLLDCGQGTYGQMVRLYGAVHTDQLLSKLSLVFISHGHSDHHMVSFSLTQPPPFNSHLHTLLPVKHSLRPVTVQQSVRFSSLPLLYQGLVTLLLARKKLYEGGDVPPLLVIGPKKLKIWFDHLNEQFNNCMKGVQYVAALSSESSRRRGITYVNSVKVLIAALYQPTISKQWDLRRLALPPACRKAERA